MSRNPDCFLFFFLEAEIDLDMLPPNSLNRNTESASMPSVFINAFIPVKVPLERNRNGKLIRTFVQSKVLVFDKNIGVWWYEVAQILSQSEEGSAMHCKVDPFFS